MLAGAAVVLFAVPVPQPVEDTVDYLSEDEVNDILTEFFDAEC